MEMASTYQGSAELIKCKLCEIPAEVFVQGLWPLCDNHKEQSNYCLLCKFKKTSQEESL